MAKNTRKSGETLDFEQSLAELEHIVENMEHGELSLEQALKDFERGIELTRACQKALQEAEQKVKMLVQKGGVEELVPFIAEQDGADES
jgi:exodeoxyribonuclease VII small subunit